MNSLLNLKNVPKNGFIYYLQGKEKMKKILLLVMIISIIFLGGGCMHNESDYYEIKNKEKTAEDYLSAKYDGEFSFASQGDDVWSSKSEISIFSDDKGQKFKVKETDGYYVDNYCSVIFDRSASEYVNSFFEDKIKVFISTQSVFLHEGKEFDAPSDYLKECSVINVAIYTTQTEYYEEIAEQLLAVMSGCTVSAVVFCVENEDYIKVTEYKNSANVLASGSFWIENNKISSKSWEE